MPQRGSTMTNSQRPCDYSQTCTNPGKHEVWRGEGNAVIMNVCNFCLFLAHFYMDELEGATKFKAAERECGTIES